MKRIRIENIAVSPVLGVILIFAIIVGGIGIFQQFYVPVWLKDAEGEHYMNLLNDFEKFHEKVIEAINYQESAIKLNPTMKYPKYPLLFTPETVSSSIIIKKIGTLQIIPNNTTQYKKFNITVFELNPYYLYLKVPREAYISGEYFILKNKGPDGVRISSPYIVQEDADEIRLILLKGVEGRTINHPETVSLKGTQLQKIDDYIIKIKIDDPFYEWYLDYLNELFEDKDFANVTYFPDRNEIQIDLDNVTLSLSMVGGGNENEYKKEIEEALNITTGVLYLTLGNRSVEEIKNGIPTDDIDLAETFKIKLCDDEEDDDCDGDKNDDSCGCSGNKTGSKRTGGGHGLGCDLHDDYEEECKNVFVATTLYISGFTGYSNAPAEVTLEYVFENDDENGGAGTIATNTIWYTSPEGYLQIPFTVPLTTWSNNGDPHNQLPDYIEITISVNGGKEIYRANLTISDFDSDSSSDS